MYGSSSGWPLTPDAALRVAADHAVAAHADHPLDVVLVLRVVAPARGATKTMISPRCGVAEVVDELVDQHPVVDVEGVLHRPGRDEERLQHERPHQERHEDRHAQQDRQLAPERTAGCLPVCSSITDGAYAAKRERRSPSGTRGVSRRAHHDRHEQQRHRPPARDATGVRPGGPAATGVRHAVEDLRPGRPNPSGSSGQRTTIARPMMLSIGTWPWQRESWDTSRWSPITNICPAGRSPRSNCAGLRHLSGSAASSGESADDVRLVDAARR